MSSVDCPYCEKEVDMSEGEYNDQNEVYEIECEHCGKYFQCTVEYYPTYTANKADCLNGSPHDLKRATRFPHLIWGMALWRCTMCDMGEERLGDESDIEKAHKSCSAEHDCPHCPLECRYRKAEKEKEKIK